MHRLTTTIVLAMRNLTLHKLRVFLTMLGLIFGVSSVIAMLAIAEGASLEAQRQIADLGATNVIVQSKKPSDDVNPSKQQNNESFIFRFGVTYTGLRPDHLDLPHGRRGDTRCASIARRCGTSSRRSRPASSGSIPTSSSSHGQRMAQGRFFSDTDLFYRANVCVLGAESAEKLFPYGDPVGKSIRIGEEHYFEVVGVTSHKAPSAGTGSSLAAQDFNRDVYIPLTTDRARFGEIIESEKQGTFTAERIELSQITVTVDAMENVKRTAEALESMLHQFHPKQDYGITVPLELLEKAEATQRIFNLVLGSIASISLLVGGIGIMNIMLATVSERTREIGIRRALGARRRDIIEQFLIETTVMSSTGGIVGVLLGLAVPAAGVADLGDAGGDPAVVAHLRLLDRRHDRRDLRRLPGAPSRDARPGRSPAHRVSSAKSSGQAPRTSDEASIVAEKIMQCRAHFPTLLRRRLCAHRAAANRHPLRQRTRRHAEAALDQVVAEPAIESEAVGVDPERDRGAGRRDPVDAREKTRRSGFALPRRSRRGFRIPGSAPTPLTRNACPCGRAARPCFRASTRSSSYAIENAPTGPTLLAIDGV